MYKLLLLCLLTPAFLAYRNVQGNWNAHSGPFKSSCPLYFEESMSYLNINTKNATEGSTDFLLYYNTDNSVFSNCTVQSSSVSCGVLSSRYKCNKDAGLFFNYSSALINVTIDFNTNAQTLTIDFVWSDKDTNSTCQYVGPKSILELPDNTYTVEKCSCPACCYKIGSRISVSELPSSGNKPFVKIEGTLEGEYCENTMFETDFCQALTTASTTLDGEPVKITTTKCNQTSCGVQKIIWGDDIRIDNTNKNYLSFSWLGCQMFAFSGWGERLGLALIGIFAIFMAF